MFIAHPNWGEPRLPGRHVVGVSHPRDSDSVLQFIFGFFFPNAKLKKINNFSFLA